MLVDLKKNRKRIRAKSSAFRKLLLFLAVVFVWGFLCNPNPVLASANRSVSSKSAFQGKKGLYKKVSDNGHFNFYYIKSDGTFLKNSLKRIRSGGQVRTYYFGSNGRAVKKHWKTIGGKRYYFKENGRAATGAFLIREQYYIFKTNGQLCLPKKPKLKKIGKTLYYIGVGGKPVPGWHVIDGKVYRVSASGKCAVNKTVGGIRFNKKGYAVDTDQARTKMYARQFISRYTNSGMTRGQKFYTCFRVIMGATRFRPFWRPPGGYTEGWPYRSAVSYFSENMFGNCFGIASAVAAVAKELGYEPYVYRAKQVHCFVCIDGKYYDNMNGTLFASPSMSGNWTIVERYRF